MHCFNYLFLFAMSAYKWYNSQIICHYSYRNVKKTRLVFFSFRLVFMKSLMLLIFTLSESVLGMDLSRTHSNQIVWHFVCKICLVKNSRFQIIHVFIHKYFPRNTLSEFINGNIKCISKSGRKKLTHIRRIFADLLYICHEGCLRKQRK